MDRASVERALFISPDPGTEPKLQWEGDELQVLIRDSLRRNRTYVINIGSESADLSRNRLPDSFSFAFATGPDLNRNEITGQLLPSVARGSRSQSFIWAFDVTDESEAEFDPAMRPPDYVTQPGSDGRFRFSRLGTGSYRIIPFEDTDRNRTFTSPGDPYGLPPADVVFPSLARESLFTLGPIRIAIDPSPPKSQSARTPDRSHLVIRFDRPVRLPDTLAVDDLAVRALFLDPEDDSRLWAVTAPQETGRTYSIHLGGITARTGGVSPPEARLEVRGDGTPDTRSPNLVRTVPATGDRFVSANAAVRLIFSEPVHASTPSMPNLLEPSDTTAAPPGIWSQVEPNVMKFQPREPWTAGAAIRLRLKLSLLIDEAGNAHRGDTDLRFQTAHPDSLGSLKGQTLPMPHPVVLQLQDLDRDRTRKSTVAPGDSAFHFSNLPEGRYRVTAFGDRNRNGKWDTGALHPFEPAEPLALKRDTVRVRARWSNELEIVVNVSSGSRRQAEPDSLIGVQP